MKTNKCDKCGETISDLDAGFSPGLHAMRHDCGGTWTRIDDDSTEREWEVTLHDEAGQFISNHRIKADTANEAVSKVFFHDHWTVECELYMTDDEESELWELNR